MDNTIITMPLLDFVMIHWIQWNAFRKKSFRGLYNDHLSNALSFLFEEESLPPRLTPRKHTGHLASVFSIFVYTILLVHCFSTFYSFIKNFLFSFHQQIWGNFCQKMEKQVSKTVWAMLEILFTVSISIQYLHTFSL